MKLMTKSGFECEIDKERLNDWETLESLEEMQTGENPFATITFAKRLLGPEEYIRFKDYVKKENDGWMPIDYSSDLLLELMNSSKEIKN